MTTATLNATMDRLSTRAGSVDWVAVRRFLLGRLPLLLLMALPFVLGFALRWSVRAAARTVWAIGWVAAWVWFTAAEGWAAAATRTG